MMPPWEREITRAARNVARLQNVRRQLRKRLRDADRELRDAKRLLKKLVGTVTDEREQSAPSKTRPGVRLSAGGDK